MRNRFSTICRSCRSQVPADGGTLEGGSGSWTCLCDACRDRAQAERTAREAELVEQQQAQGHRIVPRARLRTIAVQEAEERAAAAQREAEAAEIARQQAVAAQQERDRREMVARQTRIERRGRERPILQFSAEPVTLESLFNQPPVRRLQSAQQRAAPTTATATPEQRNLALNYRQQGYRVISRAKGIISRIDKENWKFEPRLRSHGNIQGTMTKEDYYRRNLSKDHLTVDQALLSIIMSSTIKASDNEPGYVNPDPNWQPERKVRRRGLIL